ncbi:flagellar motor protein MotB [Bradyrhizobium barranii subsp. barranii]
MAKKKRGDAHGGGHGWFVTFADLMGLMMSFFVMARRVLDAGRQQAEDRRRLHARRIRCAERGALRRYRRV